MERAEARLEGKKHYQGKPCSKCRSTVRYTSCALCVACTKVRATARNAAYPEKRSERSRALHRKSRYGLTVPAFEKLVAKHGGVCAICKEPCALGKALSVDHDHSCCPGEISCGICVRGLLCRRCNRLLGDCKERIEVLEAAIGYLRAGGSL
ncbi:MAG: endonuclease VII domain-containing protein [Nocardiaceae bacterium]|nr:endonuclease VII domain-containing protein [Nocardiaceae bacterium]